MNRNLLFLGNDGNLLREILKLRYIKLIGVVADEMTKPEKRYFGSSFFIGRRLGVRVLSQADFNNNYKEYFKNIFKDIDIIFMQGYHYRIKKDLLKNERIKIVNFHQSLLPQYGGRHPLNWAILKGEKVTGITFHYITDEFDEGDIMLQEKIRISENDNVITLYNKTIKAGSKNIRKVLALLYDSSFKPSEQDLTKRKYFAPRGPKDGEILRDDTFEQIKNKIRALVFPYPGAFIYLNGKRIILDDVKKIRKAKKYHNISFVGRHDRDIILRAADSLLRVTKIRRY